MCIEDVPSCSVITFYTSRVGPSCRATQMLLAHLGIAVKEVNQRCYVDTRTEEFRKINPCHTLPVINDNGFILWESRAIMQYLCNKYAPDSQLYPRDARKRATVERLLNFDLKTLSHAVLTLHFEYTFPAEVSASRGEKLMAVTEALTLLEIFLVQSAYVAGEHLTIADMSILTSVTLLEVAVEFDLTSYPNIWTWYNRLRSELPYYDPLTKKAHGELRALIQSVREAHEEWSTPMQRCAFVPNNGDDDKCIHERKQQYQRLFLKPSDQQDVERIMAAISPVFANRHQPQSPTERTSRIDSRGAPYSLHRSTPRMIPSYETSMNKIKRIKLSTKPDREAQEEAALRASLYEPGTTFLGDLTNIDLQELSTLDHQDAPLFDDHVLGGAGAAPMYTRNPGQCYEDVYSTVSHHDWNASVESSIESDSAIDYIVPHHGNVYNPQYAYQSSEWPPCMHHPANYGSEQQPQQQSVYAQHGPVSYYNYESAVPSYHHLHPHHTLAPPTMPSLYYPNHSSD